MEFRAITKFLCFFLAVAFYSTASPATFELAESNAKLGQCMNDTDCKICNSSACVSSGSTNKVKAHDPALSSGLTTENSVEELAGILDVALSLDRNADNFIAKIESTLGSLVKLGAIPVKPALEYDYSKIYIPRKPLTIAGANIALLEYQVFENWIGCCVNPGFSMALVIDNPNQRPEIFAYAKLRNCSVNEEVSIMGYEDLIPTENKSFITLDCGVDDSFEEPGPSDRNKSSIDESSIVPGEQASDAAVKQPKNWDVLYQDGSCMVTTDATGIGNEAPYLIKMGHMHGNQLPFIFSAKNEWYKRINITEKTKSKFIVDGKQFETMAIKNIDGELILIVENSLDLQQKLSKAKSLGIQIKLPHMDDFINAAEFVLQNINEARNWLDACNRIGVGALPQENQLHVFKNRSTSLATESKTEARQDDNRRWLEHLCPHIGCRLPARVDLQLIEASNVVVRSHPEFQGTLKLDAILHNRASVAQPFPLLELRFADTQGKLLASRRFKPSEYLGDELAGRQEMPPQTPIRISLDILDPGPDAANYSVAFFSPE